MIVTADVRKLELAEVDGYPGALARDIYSSAQSLITVGVWDFSQPFSETFRWNEVMVVLEGTVVVKEEGAAPVQVPAGGVIVCPQGCRATFEPVGGAAKTVFVAYPFVRNPSA